MVYTNIIEFIFNYCPKKIDQFSCCYELEYHKNISKNFAKKLLSKFPERGCKIIFDNREIIFKMDEVWFRNCNFKSIIIKNLDIYLNFNNCRINFILIDHKNLINFACCDIKIIESLRKISLYDCYIKKYENIHCLQELINNHILFFGKINYGYY